MRGQRAIVTGGSGFLGSHLVDELRDRGVTVFAPTRETHDLLSSYHCEALFQDFPEPDYVFHLAATVGGIGANLRLPAKFLSENVMMNVNMVDATRKLGRGAKFVALGSVCGYPEIPPRIPFREDDLWAGYPEPTNAPYGLTKRLLLAHIEASRKQYGFNAVYLIPTNLYGPRDNFHPQHSHVIPALIRKVHDVMVLGRDYLTIWGTGNPTRDFLYVKDCVSAIILAARDYDLHDPINLGSGVETSIKEAAEIIAKTAGFEGRFLYDPKKPDGQPRRVLDITRAEKLLQWRRRFSLEEGIAETWEWYTGNDPGYSPN